MAKETDMSSTDSPPQERASGNPRAEDALAEALFRAESLEGPDAYAAARLEEPAAAVAG